MVRLTLFFRILEEPFQDRRTIEEDGNVDAVANTGVYYGRIIAGAICYVILISKSSIISRFISEWPEKYQLIPPLSGNPKALPLFNIGSIILYILTVMAYATVLLSSPALNLYFNTICSILLYTIFGMFFYVGVLFTILMHSTFCIILKRYYKEMSRKINYIKPSESCKIQYASDILGGIRLQHALLVRGGRRFGDIFSVVLLIIYLDVMIMGSFLVYQLVYYLVEVGIELEVIKLIKSLLNLVIRVTPLIMFGCFSDMPSGEVSKWGLARFQSLIT